MVLNLVNIKVLPELLAICILISYSIYATVGIWRCAINVDWWGWTYIVRVIVIFSVITFILELAEIV
jgi:hypothetical protein